MILLFRATWDFDLYKNDKTHVITIVFSEYNNYCQLDVLRSFQLTHNDLINIRTYSDLSTLAETIRTAYPNNRQVEIKPYIFITGKNIVQNTQILVTLLPFNTRLP